MLFRTMKSIEEREGSSSKIRKVEDGSTVVAARYNAVQGQSAETKKRAPLAPKKERRSLAHCFIVIFNSLSF